MRRFVGALLAILIAMGLYVGSAIVSLNALVDAARRGDGAGVLARTDTVRLRQSLIDQIVSGYLKHLGRDRPVKPLERLSANTYGASIADAMITKMLTEQNLTAMLNKGSVSLDGTEVARIQGLGAVDTSNILKALSRISPVKPVELFVRLGDTAEDGGVSLHFQGNGWKLSGIRLPGAAVETLVQTLGNGRKAN